jgi:hypothetical protein
MLSVINSKKKLKSVVGIFAFVFAMSAMSGCGGSSGSGTNPTISGVVGPTVSYTGGNFVMSVVLTTVNLQGGLTLPIPSMPNSTAEVGPDVQSGGTLISVSLSAKDIASLSGGAVVLVNNTLPGGRALPGVAAGSLPSISLEVPSWDNMVFYIGPSLFGVFIPVDLNLGGSEVSADFYSSAGALVGTISIISNDSSGANGGFLVLIPISGQVGSLIKKAARN